MLMLRTEINYSLYMILNIKNSYHSIVKIDNIQENTIMENTET